MATNEPESSSSADKIRSLQDQDSIYKAFDSYPWTKDDTFKSGLHAILGGPSTPNPNDIATHARIFYYSQRIGVQVDFSSYKAWLAQHPDHKAPNVLPNEYIAAAGASQSQGGLPWQQAAPKADLYIDRRQNSGSLGIGRSSTASSPSAGADGQPTYPVAFADMIKMLQEGKEIPGIRQIPNTIARDPSVKPVGSRAAPRKPWEKESVPTPTTELRSDLDPDFPPLEEDAPPNGASQEHEGVTSG